MNSSTKRDFEITRITRQNILTTIKELTFDQVTSIPNGFSNSILWNFMHNMVTQQLLTYSMVGVKCNLDQDIIDKFRKGSAGDNSISEKEFVTFKEKYISLINKTENDFHELQSHEFKTYTTSYNITLNSLEDSIQFINTHEGLHFGIMMALKKLV
ncbi:MAG TPA: DinB family protein [Crocinitomicaceae bacterium]|nr:DinB family protein [Crocinitomicaceae bacterium]